MMAINGTLVNYYIHCKRQCWLHGNRINLEDDSERVKIGKALHEARADKKKNAEIAIDNIKIDQLTPKYLIEVKKSDADYDAVKWQLLYYLKVLKEKGIERIGKIEFIEKNKSNRKIFYETLTIEAEEQLQIMEEAIETLILQKKPPEPKITKQCRACAYYGYCKI